MVVGKNKKILLFICALTLLLLLICYKSFDNRRGNHAEKIIIFLEKNKGTKTPYILEKEIILNSIKYYFDYSIEKKTVLCLDMDDKIIEKNVITNEVPLQTPFEWHSCHFLSLIRKSTIWRIVSYINKSHCSYNDLAFYYD